MGCSQGSSDVLSKRSLPYARPLRDTTDDPGALGGISVALLLKGSQIRTVPLPDGARPEPRRVARTRTPSIEKGCWTSGIWKSFRTKSASRKLNLTDLKLEDIATGVFTPVLAKHSK